MQENRKNMSGTRVMLVVLLGTALGTPAASAGEIPFLRQLLEQQFFSQLADHNSQDSPWYNEKRVDKKKYTSGKLLGRKIRLASWTEESKTWLWLEDPNEKLTLELKRLDVHDARVDFALVVTAKAHFKAFGRIPKLARAAVGGTVHVAFEVEGSTAMGGGGLQGTQITLFNGKLHDLQFYNDAGSPFEKLVEDGLNDYVHDKNAKVRRSIEKAIDRVKF